MITVLFVLMGLSCLNINLFIIIIIIIVTTSRTWFEHNDVIFQIVRQYFSFHPVEHQVQGLKGSQELVSSCEEYVFPSRQLACTHFLSRCLGFLCHIVETKQTHMNMYDRSNKYTCLLHIQRCTLYCMFWLQPEKTEKGIQLMTVCITLSNFLQLTSITKEVL